MTASSAAKCESPLKAFLTDPRIVEAADTAMYLAACVELQRLCTALETCADVCEAEGKKLDHERETGHHAIKDERRARAESAYFCAHLVREHVKQALRPRQPGAQET